MPRCLLIVDPQTDFISGSLAVPGAKNAINELAACLRANPERYALTLVTSDSHPADHCSFQKSGGHWPEHCIAGTSGAEIWPELDTALREGNKPVIILPKGTDKDREEYSVFRNETSRARLISELAAYGIDEIEICGVAGDVCVLDTLKDALKLPGQFKFAVLDKFTASLDGGISLSRFCDQESVCIR